MGRYRRHILFLYNSGICHSSITGYLIGNQSIISQICKIQIIVNHCFLFVLTEGNRSGRTMDILIFQKSCMSS